MIFKFDILRWELSDDVDISLGYETEYDTEYKLFLSSISHL